MIYLLPQVRHGRGQPWTTWDPAETFRPKCLRHRQAWVYYKFSQQPPMSRPELIPIHSPNKIPSHTPRSTILNFHTKRTYFHTPNLPPILIYHLCPFHSPHPDSVSHIGYTRPPSRPHGSHCTCTTGWIPSMNQVPYASTGYSHGSSRAQGLRSDSYPPNTHITFSS